MVHYKIVVNVEEAVVATEESDSVDEADDALADPDKRGVVTTCADLLLLVSLLNSTSPEADARIC